MQVLCTNPLMHALVLLFALPTQIYAEGPTIQVLDTNGRKNNELMDEDVLFNFFSLTRLWSPPDALKTGVFDTGALNAVNETGGGISLQSDGAGSPVMNFPILAGTPLSINSFLVEPCSFVALHSHDNTAEPQTIVQGEAFIGQFSGKSALNQRHLEIQAINSGGSFAFPTDSVHFWFNPSPDTQLFTIGQFSDTNAPETSIRGGAFAKRVPSRVLRRAFMAAKRAGTLFATLEPRECQRAARDLARAVTTNKHYLSDSNEYKRQAIQNVRQAPIPTFSPPEAPFTGEFDLPMGARPGGGDMLQSGAYDDSVADRLGIDKSGPGSWPDIDGLGFSVVGIVLEPDGMLEPHLHGSAVEFVTVLRQSDGRIVLGTSGNQYIVGLGDLDGYTAVFPRGQVHYLRNIGGPEQLGIVGGFTSSSPTRTLLSDMTRLIPEVPEGSGTGVLESAFGQTVDFGGTVADLPTNPFVIIPT